MLKLKFPCRGCTKRELGCHANCEEYKKVKMSGEAIYEKKRKEDEFRDYVHERSIKIKKHMRKRDVIHWQ